MVFKALSLMSLESLESGNGFPEHVSREYEEYAAKDAFQGLGVDRMRNLRANRGRENAHDRYREKRWQMETNFFGMTNVCACVLPYMRERRSGKIINISSIAGVVAVPYQGYYSASKFAVEGFSEALAVEIRRFGITVCVVEPGDFRTGFTASRKVSSVSASHPEYAASFERTMISVEKDETHGSDPRKLGRVLCRLVRSHRPPFRTLTGGCVQTAFARVSRILPGRLTQKLLRWFYSV